MVLQYNIFAWNISLFYSAIGGTIIRRWHIYIYTAYITDYKMLATCMKYQMFTTNEIPD